MKAIGKTLVIGSRAVTPPFFMACGHPLFYEPQLTILF